VPVRTVRQVCHCGGCCRDGVLIDRWRAGPGTGRHFSWPDTDGTTHGDGCAILVETFSRSVCVTSHYVKSKVKNAEALSDTLQKQ